MSAGPLPRPARRPARRWISRRTVRAAWDLHSATGVALGLVLVVFFWGGAVALYADGLRQWERPAERVAYDGPLVDVDARLATVLGGADTGGAVRVSLPTPERPALGVAWADSSVQVHPATGAVLAPQESYVGQLLVELHALAWLPHDVGLALAGWAGLVAVVTALTGLTVHVRTARAGALLRVQVSRRGRAAWASVHRVVGTLSLPFALVVATTGAVIGVGHVYYLAVTPVALGGDPEGYIGDLGVPRPAAAPPEPSGPVRVDAALAAARAAWPAADAEEVVVEGDGPGALVTVRVRDRAALTGGAGDVGLGLLAVRAGTGAVVARVDPSRPATAGAAVWQGTLGLHYGTFGGALLKALYAALALAVAATAATGNALWLSARLRRHPERAGHYERLGRLSVGVAAGLIPATAALLVANKAVPMDLAGRAAWEGAAFYGAWATSVGAALASSTARRAARTLAVAGGALALAVPVLNGAVTGDWAWRTLAEGPAPVFWVDAVALAAGLALVGGGLRPRPRSGRARGAWR